MTFEKLIMDAINIKGGIDVWNGVGTDVKHIDVSDVTKRKNHKRYAINNSVLAFVYRDEMFVIPVFPEVLETLNKKGFASGEFFVPFSNGEVPRHKMGQWHELLKEANRKRV